MKIAYLFSRYPVPSQTFCDTEIRALEAAGHEIEIFSCSAPTSSFRHGGPAVWPRAPVFYAPPASVLKAWEEDARGNGSWPEAMVAEHLAQFGASYDPARRARHALYFADRLRRRGIEHLHVHFANRATHAALFMHELTGVPFSFTAHAQDFLVDLGNDDLLRLMCERASFVVAVSDWSRRVLIERCPATESKIYRVYNGLPVENWVKDAPAQPAFDHGVKIFSAGRLIAFKGFQDLLAACRLLRGRGVRFFCEIAGEGPLRSALEEQAAEFSQPDARIEFAGLLGQDEIRARMEACDVFALASRVDEKGACDVLPTVVLEAMVCAKPVVSTRLAGIPEMVDHGQTGLLTPPGDVVALADALQTLADHEEERHRLGRMGRCVMTEKFSAASSAEQLTALFTRANAENSNPFKPTVSEKTERELFLLFDRWPMEQGQFASLPPDDAGILALEPGNLAAASVRLHDVEYLPDDVVFETYWRQRDPLVHQLESWRGVVGGGCAAEDYLLACRRAYYLRSTLLSSRVARRHLHAVGFQAVLCVWLLRRLEVADTISFLLPAGESGGWAVVRKLAPDFAGGWLIGQSKLAASFGPDFCADQPDDANCQQSLKLWTHGRPR